MEKSFAAEHIADIDPCDLPGIDSVLDQKTCKSSLHKAVLIPVGVGFDETRHRQLQGSRQLTLKTHQTFAPLGHHFGTLLHLALGNDH